MTYKLICTIIFSYVITLAFAQDESSSSDYIFLKNGSRFEGKLLEYEVGGRVRFELENGNVLVFHEKTDVRKVIQGHSVNIQPIKAQKDYAFKEKGMYLFISGLTSFGKSAFDNEINSGVGLHGVIGMQQNRWFGYGLGIGTDLYYIGSSQQFVPVYTEFRGYLNQRNAAPYYAVQTGYGFALKDEESNVEDAQGGIYFHPAIGLRCGASDNVNFTIDLGVKFQRGTFETNWWSTITQDMTYRRFVIRVGALF